MKVNFMKIGWIIIVTMCAFLKAEGGPPRSKQATLIESVSPTEILVRASGIGHWEKGQGKKKDLENYLFEEALWDARRSAVWFVLEGGTDPLLRSSGERDAFRRWEEEFYDPSTVQLFIAWEGTDILNRQKREIRKKTEYELTIEKAFKINKQAIQDWLVRKGVIQPTAEVAEVIGNPFIMVIPATGKGENPLDLLRQNSHLSHAAKVIEGYLTQRQYDVVVPEQQVVLAELTSAQQFIKGLEEDPSYALALSVGSDIYITYEVKLEYEPRNTRKAVVNVRAYETTTARLLGTETGYSPTAQASEMALIENAVNDAIDKVLSRINAYWKEDLNRGVQYKVIVTIEGAASPETAEEVQIAFLDLWDGLTHQRRFKENVITQQVLDYNIWCDPREYRQTLKLYRKMKEMLERSHPRMKLSQVNLNRKLLLLKVNVT
ncbi:MAG: DUF6175 family protein [bacterium]